MPKGRKRTKEEYEEEVEEAAKRMKKYPEHLKAAKNNTTWLTFLDNIGVATTETKQGQGFWDRVRSKIKPTRPTWREPYINPATKQTSYRDKSGRFVSPASIGAPARAKPVKLVPTSRQLIENLAEAYENPKTRQVSYRDVETGKFKKIE